LNDIIKEKEGRSPPYNVVPLSSHPYADPSVECENGVSVALHNYFLSIIIIIIIIILKRDRSLAVEA